MIPWKFKAINSEEYEAEITLTTGARIIKKLFEKTKKKLIKRTGHDLKDADHNVIKEFSIPEDMEYIFFPVVNRATLKVQKDIIKKVKVDGINILDVGVKGVVYRLMDNGGWLILVTLGGRYIEN